MNTILAPRTYFPKETLFSINGLHLRYLLFKKKKLVKECLPIRLSESHNTDSFLLNTTADQNAKQQ